MAPGGAACWNCGRYLSPDTGKVPCQVPAGDDDTKVALCCTSCANSAEAREENKIVPVNEVEGPVQVGIDPANMTDKEFDEIDQFVKGLARPRYDGDVTKDGFTAAGGEIPQPACVICGIPVDKNNGVTVRAPRNQGRGDTFDENGVLPVPKPPELITACDKCAKENELENPWTRHNLPPRLEEDLDQALRNAKAVADTTRDLGLFGTAVVKNEYDRVDFGEVTPEAETPKPDDGTYDGPLAGLFNRFFTRSDKDLADAMREQENRDRDREERNRQKDILFHERYGGGLNGPVTGAGGKLTLETLRKAADKIAAQTPEQLPEIVSPAEYANRVAAEADKAIKDYERNRVVDNHLNVKPAAVVMPTRFADHLYRIIEPGSRFDVKWDTFPLLYWKGVRLIGWDKLNVPEGAKVIFCVGPTAMADIMRGNTNAELGKGKNAADNG